MYTAKRQQIQFVSLNIVALSRQLSRVPTAQLWLVRFTFQEDGGVGEILGQYQLHRLAERGQAQQHPHQQQQQQHPLQSYHQQQP